MPHPLGAQNRHRNLSVQLCVPRSLTARYLPASCESLSNFQGLIDRQGNPVARQQTTDGGPCDTEFEAVAH